MSIGWEPNSIIKPEVARLGLREQGVLISAVRGPDGVSRDDPIKVLVRMFRGEILRPHCGDLSKSSSYMFPFDIVEFNEAVDAVLKSCDHYNLHFFLHFTHAVEILGYAPASVSPNHLQWQRLYMRICRKLHLTPEAPNELYNRLGADEESFSKQQDQ